ncbi:23S rRNA (guanine(745)-N(1))-methyltransferase [Psychromonas sp. CD1]|uniref:23S rRNA (guanine(745)-N(1))-methyltransferase n=1 Tax=Psychromonas sp. CD1 TaxID=1979839 RepID=UPI000B9A69D1|nr:23S rRNA (guanine(745)-N(1))-methyltransferase [Psychromonas sp. CD1]
MHAFICPLCHTSFLTKNNTKICQNNHHFDIAKEGYLNLLPVQAKSSKNPGDNKKMMQARRAFLNSEGYRPMADKLCELVTKKLLGKSAPHILDLGCGEGYYTNLLANSLSPEAHVSALDISKVAIRYAAKRYKTISFCVASAYAVPLVDSSLDAIIRIYAPSLESELQRLIKPGAYLFTVTPAPRHLFQLREKIYTHVNEHISSHNAPLGFHKVDSVNVNYILSIDNAQILHDLIQMTPFAWKFNPQKMQDLLNARKWKIECDFNIEIYQKSAPSLT